MRLFCNREKTVSLKTSAMSGVMWTTMSTVAITVIQLTQMAILTRFLSPGDFGLMAILMVVIGFSQAFMDMGISNAIIHKQNITHTQLSSLYWLNIGAGLAMTIITFFVSPLVARFYVEPRLAELMMVLSSVFVIVAIGNQYRILFQKELQFTRMAKIEVISSIFSFAVAVYFAVMGFGVYSLVFAMLTQAFASSAMFLFVGLREHHRPTFVYKHSELAGFYSFGLFQMGERSINYFSANIDKLIIGKMLGMQTVGFYDMAWRLIAFPLQKINPIVNKVAFPIYARMQNDSIALNRYYTFNVKALSIITVPLLAFLSFFSHDVVLVVFGPGWNQTASLVTVLAFVGILKALGNPGGAIVLALGRAEVGFWWNLIWAAFVSIIMFVMLYHFPQVEVAAYSLLALSLTVGLFWHYIIAKVAKIKYWPIAWHFGKLIFITFIIGRIGCLTVDMLLIEKAFYRLVLGGVVFAILYCGFILLFEKEILKHLKGR
jgi:O-antigen/teichoic acid export membrane protein